ALPICDFGNPVNITGIVKYVRFANPHAKIILEVTDDARGTRDIEYEGHSRNNMVRQGLVPNLFGVGETITVRIAPMRDGSDGGYVTALITEDGEAVGRSTGADSARRGIVGQHPRSHHRPVGRRFPGTRSGGL